MYTPFAQCVWEGMLAGMHCLDVADAEHHDAPHKQDLKHRDTRLTCIGIRHGISHALQHVSRGSEWLALPPASDMLLVMHPSILVKVLAEFWHLTVISDAFEHLSQGLHWHVLPCVAIEPHSSSSSHTHP